MFKGQKSFHTVLSFFGKLRDMENWQTRKGRANKKKVISEVWSMSQKNMAQKDGEFIIYGNLRTNQAPYRTVSCMCRIVAKHQYTLR
jgi:hypothetical protein